MSRASSSSIKPGLRAKRERTKRYVLARNAEHGNGERREKHETKDSKRGNKRIDHTLVEHAETQHAGTVNVHSGRLIEHAEKVTEHAEKANKHAEREPKLREEGIEHLDAKEATNNEETEHAKGRIAHVRVPTTHEQQHETIALNEKVREEKRKKRQRSRQFKNVPLNERERFKARCVQLLSTS